MQGLGEHDRCQVGQQSIKLLGEISEELEQAGLLTRQPQIKAGPGRSPDGSEINSIAIAEASLFIKCSMRPWGLLEEQVIRPGFEGRKRCYVTGYRTAESGLRPTYWPNDLGVDT